MEVTGPLAWSKARKLSVAASKRGVPRSEETRQKLSEAHSGKTLTEEHKQRISESGKGIPRTEAQIAAVIHTNKTRVRTEDEQRRKGINRKVNTARKYGICPAIYAAFPRNGRSGHVQRFLKHQANPGLKKEQRARASNSKIANNAARLGIPVDEYKALSPSERSKPLKALRESAAS